MVVEADLAGLSHKTCLAQHQAAFGRWLVPGYGRRCDQIPGTTVYPTNVNIETLANGERRQRFNRRDMVFTFGNTSKTYPATALIIQATSSAAGRRPAQQRIRASCCPTALRAG